MSWERLYKVLYTPLLRQNDTASVPKVNTYWYKSKHIASSQGFTYYPESRSDSGFLPHSVILACAKNNNRKRDPAIPKQDKWHLSKNDFLFLLTKSGLVLVSKTGVSTGVTDFLVPDYVCFTVSHRLQSIQGPNNDHSQMLTQVSFRHSGSYRGPGSPLRTSLGPKESYRNGTLDKTRAPAPFELGGFHIAPMGKSGNKSNLYD